MITRDLNFPKFKTRIRRTLLCQLAPGDDFIKVGRKAGIIEIALSICALRLHPTFWEIYEIDPRAGLQSSCLIQFSLGKTAARLIFKIMLKFLHIGPETFTGSFRQASCIFRQKDGILFIYLWMFQIKCTVVSATLNCLSTVSQVK